MASISVNQALTLVTTNLASSYPASVVETVPGLLQCRAAGAVMRPSFRCRLGDKVVLGPEQGSGSLS